MHYSKNRRAAKPQAFAAPYGTATGRVSSALATKQETTPDEYRRRIVAHREHGEKLADRLLVAQRRNANLMTANGVLATTATADRADAHQRGVVLGVVVGAATCLVGYALTHMAW
jgi:hypothetical protein